MDEMRHNAYDVIRPAATPADMKSEDMSRFEGEGGRRAPEHRDQIETNVDTAAWKELVLQYQKPSIGRALWQMANTLVPYVLLWYLMYLSLPVSWWLAVPLAILAGAFMVRIFIIHHDCGHGSFFKSRKANDVLGFITGVLTFTTKEAALILERLQNLSELTAHR